MDDIPKREKSKKWYQILMTFIATLTIVSVGLHASWTSPTLPMLLSEDSPIPIDGYQGSWLAVGTLISAMFGAIMSSYFVDVIGRKKSMLISIPFYLTSWILIAVGNNFYVLMAARIIAGLSDGLAYTVVPMYIAEIADGDIRGFLGSSVTVFLIIGQLLINAIGPFISIKKMALLALSIPLLQLSVFKFVPESPYFLLMKEEKGEARICLERLRRHKNVDNELEQMDRAVKQQMSESGRFRDLFLNKSNRKAVFISIGLRTVQQLSGVTAFNYYTQYIFSTAGDKISPTMSAIIYMGLQLILCFFSSLLLDRLGRRVLFTFSCVGSSLTLFVLGSYFYLQTETATNLSNLYWIPMVAMLLYIFLFSIGMCSIPITMLGELFPTNIKAKALAFMELYFSLIAGIVTKVFQFVADEFGIYVPFFMFAICCVFGIAFSLLCVPETKGKTLEEIQSWLRNETPKLQKKEAELHQDNDQIQLEIIERRVS